MYQNPAVRFIRSSIHLLADSAGYCVLKILSAKHPFYAQTHLLSPDIWHNN